VGLLLAKMRILNSIIEFIKLLVLSPVPGKKEQEIRRKRAFYNLYNHRYITNEEINKRIEELSRYKF